MLPINPRFRCKLHIWQRLRGVARDYHPIYTMTVQNILNDSVQVHGNGVRGDEFSNIPQPQREIMLDLGEAFKADQSPDKVCETQESD